MPKVAPPVESEIEDKAVSPKLLRQVVIEKMNFQTMKMELLHAVREDDATELPESLTLFAFFSFLDDDGNHHSWSAGQVVTAADEMRDLIARGAVFKG